MRHNGVVIICIMEQHGKGKRQSSSCTIDENQCVLQQLVSSIDT